MILAIQGKCKMHESWFHIQSILHFSLNFSTTHNIFFANPVTGQTHPQKQGYPGNPDPTNPPNSLHSHLPPSDRDRTHPAKTPSTANRFLPSTPLVPPQVSPPPQYAPLPQTTAEWKPTRRPEHSGSPTWRPEPQRGEPDSRRRCRRRGSTLTSQRFPAEPRDSRRGTLERPRRRRIAKGTGAPARGGSSRRQRRRGFGGRIAGTRRRKHRSPARGKQSRRRGRKRRREQLRWRRRRWV